VPAVNSMRFAVLMYHRVGQLLVCNCQSSTRNQSDWFCYVTKYHLFVGQLVACTY